MPASVPKIIRPENLLQIRTVSEPQLSPDGMHIAYVITKVDIATENYIANLWIVNTRSGESRQFTQGQQRDMLPRWSPDGKQIAFFSNRNEENFQLYVAPFIGGEAKKIASRNPSCQPAAWSPDGKYLAFTARIKDHELPASKVNCYLSDRSPKVVTRAYFKSDGEGYVEDTIDNLFIASVEGGSLIQLTNGDCDDSAPSWSPDGNKIAFCRKQNGIRDYNLSDIWVVDVESKNLKRITTTIKHATSPSWSPDGTSIAFYGTDEDSLGLEETLFRVWVLPLSEGTPYCLTRGYDRGVIMHPRPAVTPGPIWSPDSEAISFKVADKGNIHIMRASVADGVVTPVVSGERQITNYSVAGGQIAFCASDPHNPGDVYGCNYNGSREQRFTWVNESLLEQLDMPKIERRTFNGPNGKTIDGWLMLPRAGNRFLPLLVDIHGGPHGFVGNYFPLSHFYRYVLASRGCAVLTLNPSGSASYGQEFAHSIQGRWGEHDMLEQLAAVDALIAEGIADGKRLAVAGYSYGGYMAAWMISHTDRFNTAVIGAPITNLESFFGTSDIGIWYASWEMGGSITARQEIFRRLSPVNYADQVTTPTLILHGEEDERCPIGQSEELFARLMTTSKVTVEFVRYPGASHLFPSSGFPSHRIDYNQRVVEWVERYTRINSC